MLPDVVAVVTTYFPEGEIGTQRYFAVLETLESWDKHLKYDKTVYIHIADDGSKIIEAFPKWYQGLLIRITRQERKGVGASLNQGFRSVYEQWGSDAIVLYAVDDWALSQEFDITPWVKLLSEREDLGMIRLGPPHPNLTGRIEHLGEYGWGLLLDNYSYIYAQRPAIYHKRFYEFYGEFPEDCSALECERIYAERVVNMNGPKVMLALPCAWQHIYTTSMSSFAPGEI